MSRTLQQQAVHDIANFSERAAHLFRATQTEEKLKREGIQGKTQVNKAHREVEATVRQTVKELGGTLREKAKPLPGKGQA